MTPIVSSGPSRPSSSRQPRPAPVRPHAAPRGRRLRARGRGRPPARRARDRRPAAPARRPTRGHGRRLPRPPPGDAHNGAGRPPARQGREQALAQRGGVGGHRVGRSRWEVHSAPGPGRRRAHPRRPARRRPEPRQRHRGAVGGRAAPRPAPEAEARPVAAVRRRRHPRAHPHQQVVQRDPHRAGVVARAAERRHERQLARALALHALQQRGQHRADRARVGRAVGLAAHAAPHRARVEAGAAADAVERLLQVRAEQGRAPAVEDHQVQLLGAVGLAGRARPGDQVDVAGRVVADRRHRQDLQDVRGLVPVAHHPLHPHHGDVDARQGGHQARVALVLDDADRPGLGHAEVDPRDADVRAREHLAQAACARGPPAPRGRSAAPSRSRPSKHLAHLLLVEVHRRGDDVARVLAGQLQDPLAEVGLDHPQPRLLDRLVELDLLRGHRLRLGHQGRPARRGEVGDVAAGRVGVGRAASPRPPAAVDPLLEAVEQLGQVADVAAADLPRPRSRICANGFSAAIRARAGAPARRRPRAGCRAARRRRAPRGCARAGARSCPGRRPAGGPLIRRAPRRCGAPAGGCRCAAPGRRCAAGTRGRRPPARRRPVAAAWRAFSSPRRPDTSGKLTLKVPPKPQQTSVASISRSSTPSTARQRRPAGSRARRAAAACGRSRGRSPIPTPRAPALEAALGDELGQLERAPGHREGGLLLGPPGEELGVAVAHHRRAGARGHDHRVVAREGREGGARHRAAPGRDAPTTSPADRSRSGARGTATSTPARSSTVRAARQTDGAITSDRHVRMSIARIG